MPTIVSSVTHIRGICEDMWQQYIYIDPSTSSFYRIAFQWLVLIWVERGVCWSVSWIAGVSIAKDGLRISSRGVWIAVGWGDVYCCVCVQYKLLWDVWYYEGSSNLEMIYWWIDEFELSNLCSDIAAQRSHWCCCVDHCIIRVVVWFSRCNISFACAEDDEYKSKTCSFCSWLNTLLLCICNVANNGHNYYYCCWWRELKWRNAVNCDDDLLSIIVMMIFCWSSLLMGKT